MPIWIINRLKVVRIAHRLHWTTVTNRTVYGIRNWRGGLVHSKTMSSVKLSRFVHQMPIHCHWAGMYSRWAWASTAKLHFPIHFYPLHSIFTNLIQFGMRLSLQPPFIRSHSPNSPRNKLSKGNHSLCSTDGGNDSNHKPLHDLNYHVRQVKNALQHFKGVISRNRLEVLPANGTVVLETIANVHTALQPYTLNENSSAIISATTQVYLSLGKLIKLCDEVLLSEDDANCASLSQENVTEVVELVEKAVQVSAHTHTISVAKQLRACVKQWINDDDCYCFGHFIFHRIWCNLPTRKCQSVKKMAEPYQRNQIQAAIHYNDPNSIYSVHHFQISH